MFKPCAMCKSKMACKKAGECLAKAKPKKPVRGGRAATNKKNKTKKK